MSMNLKYAPATVDNAEFHRIREWHNTFNAFVQGALASDKFFFGDEEDMRDVRREAKKFANKVHGRISKPKPARSYNPWEY